MGKIDLFKQMGEVFNPNPLPILEISEVFGAFDTFDNLTIAFVVQNKPTGVKIEESEIQAYYNTKPAIIHEEQNYIEAGIEKDVETILSFAEYLSKLETEDSFLFDLLEYHLTDKTKYSKIIIK
jgi:hypothetical protein